ncbi:ABC transporter substrate-binding protein [Roseiarcaceae bacterium H3SJ34-1]|uniref:ABC transporter substrate-binding protein n=1 Tax=Terripilifer ovatus TaxID=3032367 RepID=UPI003AB95F77|nr:ABC transporter substrate-binding protein [Roseiarcaceae bacterium H3SJ34-1]
MKKLITAALMAGLLAAGGAQAQQTVKIGLIAPMTGPQAAAGRQMVAGAKLYMALNGNKAGGKTVELIVKDDTGVADITRRLAQELIVNDKVAVITGFGLTPLALAVGPVITQAKVPAVIMVAGTAAITGTSPYFVRISFTLPQQTIPSALWAAENGIKSVVSLVADYGPGIDAQDAFKKKFEEKGGKVLEQLRAPLLNPDYAPFLQRAKDLKPDALMLFVPAPQAGALMRQVMDRGFPQAGIKVIGPGDAFDDEQLNAMGDGVIGSVTSYNYSAAHDSPENKKFVTEFKKANDNVRPNLIGLGGYDGLHAIYAALEKTKGETDGPKLLEAFKGLTWTSPRGPVTIDPQTREPIQNIYIRKVERKDGELYHIEFATYPNQKTP